MLTTSASICDRQRIPFIVATVKNICINDKSNNAWLDDAG